MAKPQRLTLSRAAGFDLQAASRALNGLDARSVARPGPFGNPFTAAGCREAGFEGSDEAVAAECVRRFKIWLDPAWTAAWAERFEADRRKRLLDRLPELRGKNLACFCKPGAPCHADVLLELANREPG